jgi:hypothetical protein
LAKVVVALSEPTIITSRSTMIKTFLDLLS